MKILMVSMPSLHFFRWTEQLRDAGHEIFWFNITDSGEFVKRLDWVKQKYAWKLKWDFSGRIYLKKHFPRLSHWIQTINTNSISKAFESYLDEVKPDVVHSFALHISCTPILSVMKKHSDLKWIYSAWGNDLFYHQNILKYRLGILEVLPCLDYMFSDCYRDKNLAFKLGFKGEFLGVFPGGGGFSLNAIDKPLQMPEIRHGILVKGYQSKMHRGINILKALEKFEQIPKVTIFSANKILMNYIRESKILKEKDFVIFTAQQSLNHTDLCRMMNQHLIYIGNNLSDGMPNTLLEAICFGAFPIQSNPGGASAEIITHGENGLLIDNCEDIEEIYSCLKTALSDMELVNKAYSINLGLRERFEFQTIKYKVLEKYNQLNSD